MDDIDDGYDNHVTLGWVMGYGQQGYEDACSIFFGVAKVISVHITDI